MTKPSVSTRTSLHILMTVLSNRLTHMELIVYRSSFCFKWNTSVRNAWFWFKCTCSCCDNKRADHSSVCVALNWWESTGVPLGLQPGRTEHHGGEWLWQETQPPWPGGGVSLNVEGSVHTWQGKMGMLRHTAYKINWLFYFKQLPYFFWITSLSGV